MRHGLRSSFQCILVGKKNSHPGALSWRNHLPAFWGFKVSVGWKPTTKDFLEIKCAPPLTPPWKEAPPSWNWTKNPNRTPPTVQTPLSQEVHSGFFTKRPNCSPGWLLIGRFKALCVLNNYVPPPPPPLPQHRGGGGRGYIRMSCVIKGVLGHRWAPHSLTAST